MADISTIPESRMKTCRICNTLAVKWEEKDSIFPPIIEAVTYNFTFRTLDRRLFQAKRKSQEKKTTVLNADDEDMAIELFQFMYQLTKKGKKPNFSTTMQGRLKKIIEVRDSNLYEIKEKLFLLMTKDQSLWDEDEQRFMKKIGNSKIAAIIKKLEKIS